MHRNRVTAGKASAGLMCGPGLARAGPARRLRGFAGCRVVRATGGHTFPVMTAELPISNRAPGRARRVLADSFAANGSDVDDEALVVISELVANAVRFARSSVRIYIDLTPDRLHLEVSDDGPGLPRTSAAAQETVHGRGLVIVAAFATRWGTQTWPGGKTVWCDLNRVARVPPAVPCQP